MRCQQGHCQTVPPLCNACLIWPSRLLLLLLNPSHLVQPQWQSYCWLSMVHITCCQVCWWLKDSRPVGCMLWQQVDNVCWLSLTHNWILGWLHIICSCSLAGWTYHVCTPTWACVSWSTWFTASACTVAAVSSSAMSLPHASPHDSLLLTSFRQQLHL